MVRCSQWDKEAKAHDALGLQPLWVIWTCVRNQINLLVSDAKHVFVVMLLSLSLSWNPFSLLCFLFLVVNLPVLQQENYYIPIRNISHLFQVILDQMNGVPGVVFFFFLCSLPSTTVCTLNSQLNSLILSKNVQSPLSVHVVIDFGLQTYAYGRMTQFYLRNADIICSLHHLDTISVKSAYIAELDVCWLEISGTNL